MVGGDLANTRVLYVPKYILGETMPLPQLPLTSTYEVGATKTLVIAQSMHNRITNVRIEIHGIVPLAVTLSKRYDHIQETQHDCDRLTRKLFTHSILFALVFDVTQQGLVAFDGIPCDHWIQDDIISRVHIYVQHDTQGNVLYTRSTNTHLGPGWVGDGR